MDQKNTEINSDLVYTPLFFRIGDPQEKRNFERFLEGKKNPQIVDVLEQQLVELMKIDRPGDLLSEQDSKVLLEQHIAPASLHDYGVWVYYPWSNRVVHILDEEEFIRVRTNRNLLKIDPEQVSILRNKTIGIIGLSVGQSIALTLAMERSCGALRLADYDTVSLSNMNRIKSGLHELGINKAIVAARQIAELDPFLKLICYTEGLHEGNMESFFTENGPLDILVEECDGIDSKIVSRLMAKKLGIPVVMDTNDKGMLDVERFDLEPDRPIFHGRLKGFEDRDPYQVMRELKNMGMADKINFLTKIIGLENVSDAMKISLSQMNKTIIGWPQLASAVALGGAIVTDVCRKILLNQHQSSGRIFVDLEQQIRDFNELDDSD